MLTNCQLLTRIASHTVRLRNLPQRQLLTYGIMHSELIQIEDALESLIIALEAGHIPPPTNQHKGG